VPFFIYHYPPAWAREIDGLRDRVITKLRSDDGLNVLEINLYDLAVQLLRERGVWHRLLALEPDMEVGAGRADRESQSRKVSPEAGGSAWS